MFCWKKKKADPREVFIGMLLPEDRKILDVGCADGSLGARLVKQGREVIGLEKDERLCVQAKAVLTQAITGDAQSGLLPFSSGYFDAIMYADVLEHLIDPAALLKQHRTYLKHGGTLIVSLPNVRYYKVMEQVFLKGVWDYRDAGILDKTHMRFFTLTNMKELLGQAGYEVLEIKRNIVASSFYRILNGLCFGLAREFLTYQYYFKARKVDGPVKLPPRKIPQF